MVLTVTWIRNDMLSSNDKSEKQLMDAEWKVQRSHQKLPTSDWHSNKRSNPLEILSFGPIESRQNSTLNLASFSLLDMSTDQKTKKDATIIIEKNNNKYSHRKSPKTRRRRFAPKSSLAEDEVSDASIPIVKLSKNNRKTFCKKSSSRKVRNTNHFSYSPRIQFSKGCEDDEIDKDAMYKTFVIKRQSSDTYRKTGSNLDNGKISGGYLQRKNNFQMLEMEPNYPRNLHVAPKFKIFSTPTPKFSPTNIFSSTTLEESLKIKRIPSKNILEKSSFFENVSKSTSLSDSSTNELENIPRSRRRMSPSVLEKTFIFEANSRAENNSFTCKKTPLEDKKTNWEYEKNIRSIDPIISEKADVNLPVPRSSSTVRDIVKKIEVSTKPVCIPGKKAHTDTKESIIPIDGKKPNFKKKVLNFLTEERKSESPYSKFLSSKRKSMELENVVKSKQPQPEKSLVRGIIETLTERMSEPLLPRENTDVGINQNFVKQLVKALEKEDTTEVENSLSERTSISEGGSFSESETKSNITSASLEYTDSNSDSDLGSLSPKSDDDQEITYDNLVTKTMDIEQKILRDDDSVYWIPVSRCKLPRSSSLFSIMSRLSINAQSPCVSPIRSESEVEDTQPAAWRSTFSKSNATYRKLFRIDETVVIDSGYSDRSDRSEGSPVISKSARIKRSSRRKSIVGHTFCIH